MILSLARDAGIPVDEGRFNVEALMAADECFLSNTTMEVMPATQLNGQTDWPVAARTIDRAPSSNFCH